MRATLHALSYLALCLLFPIAGCPSGDDDDSAADDDATESATLSNNPGGCEDPFWISPYTGEELQWGAARLTPPAYPFVVEGIIYTVPAAALGPVTCDTTLAHTVWLFSGPDVAPPTSPTPLAEISVPEGGTAGVERLVEITVDPPVTVPADEHLFIAVQWSGLWPDVLCLRTCRDDGGEADRNYWSVTTEVPFDWKQLADWNIQANYLFEASGGY